MEWWLRNRNLHYTYTWAKPKTLMEWQLNKRTYTTTLTHGKAVPMRAVPLVTDAFPLVSVIGLFTIFFLALVTLVCFIWLFIARLFSISLSLALNKTMDIALMEWWRSKRKLHYLALMNYSAQYLINSRPQLSKAFKQDHFTLMLSVF